MQKIKVYILIEHLGWNAKNHADGLVRHAPPTWDITVCRWHAKEQDWHFDDADVIINLGSHLHGKLYKECCARAPNALLLSRYNTCYPRYEDKFNLLHKCSDAVLVESRKCFQLARPGHPRVYLAPSGVDGSVFRITAPPSRRPNRVLWCAGIIGQSEERAKVKRYEMALEIAARLKEHGLEMEVLAVDPNGETLKTRAEMIDWYNSGRIFVCTSIMEGVPNTILEAAACGCSIVSTPVGIVPEFIKHGLNGYVVQPTVDAFVEAIQQANKEYLQHVGDIKREVAEKDWNKLTGHYVQLVDELLCLRDGDEGDIS